MQKNVFGTTTFLAHYNGNTGYSGLNADYAVGAADVTIPNPTYGIPTINSTIMKFGSGAVNLDWWSGRNMQYSAANNYKSSAATIDFQLNISKAFAFDSVDNRYEFVGNKRYVFNDDLAWGKSGHVDIWIDGTAGNDFVRLVAHVTGTTTYTLMSPVLYYNGAAFQHFALQWDTAAGQMGLFTDGVLSQVITAAPWTMANSATVFKLGMQSVNTGSLILDEFCISDTALYDTTVGQGVKSFNVPTSEYLVPEPTTMALLGIGSFILLRTKK